MRPLPILQYCDQWTPYNCIWAYVVGAYDHRQSCNKPFSKHTHPVGVEVVHYGHDAEIILLGIHGLRVVQVFGVKGTAACRPNSRLVSPRVYLVSPPGVFSTAHRYV